MEEYVIETINLSKSFGSKLAVNKVNMHVAKGDIYGFIGRNGAGKTTAMKLILGTLRANEGSIKLFNDEKNLDNSRRRIGSLIEAPGLYRNASAYENMKRFSLLYGGTDEDIKEILEFVGLADTGKKKAGAFSLGMKQRLGIGIALLGNPEILILDEPVNGLDPAGIKEIRDTIIKLNKEKGVTFLISSHLLDELAKITTRYGIIADGELVEEIDASELMKKCEDYLKIKVSNIKKSVEVLNKNKLLGRYKDDGKYLYLYDHFDKAAQINEVLVSNGVKVEELSPCNSGLEDYFIERLGR